jgi:5-methylcytosine-specific restriction endonuclease McrA
MPIKDPVAEAAYQRAYREKHKEYFRQYRISYRQQNPELVKSQKRQDYERHSESYKDRAAVSWSKKEYWEKKHHRSMVKARSSGCEIVSESSIRQYFKEVFSESEQTCTYCHGVFGIKNITIDHKTPKSKGGKHEVSNFVVSCCSCNVKKHTTPYEVWIAAR